eukprot:PITA_21992
MLVIFQLICLIPSQTIPPENDVQCLQTTFKEWKDPLGNLYTWNFKNATKGFICNFLGITCWHDDDNKVMSISLQDMGLQGEFPSGVQYCKSTTSLTLSQNSLTGTIPKELCQWIPFLVTVDLSQNMFMGPIPIELHNCTYLNILRLNGNQLTGEIPWQLTRLNRLKDFNVANNKLTGNIPSFTHNFSPSSFQGNPGLCGPPLSKACESTNGPVNPMVVVAFLLFGIVLIVWILLGLHWMISKAKKRRSAKIPFPTSREPSDWQKYVRVRRCVKVRLFEKPMRKMRLDDLLAATQDFSEDNIILCRRTGILYKRKLPDGSLLAATRLKICIGTARGFAWLHHSYDPHVVRRNISSGIIFLDEEYEPRISGFGLARLLNPEDSHYVTISCSGEKTTDEVVEEFGYDAPKTWRNTSVATLKGDVYSFGILVLEIITGLRPRDTIMDEESRNEMTFLECIHGAFVHEGVDCIEQAIQRYHANQMNVSSEDWIHRLFAKKDCVERVKDRYRANQMAELSDEDISAVAEVPCVAFECVTIDPGERPSMYEVYKRLMKIGERYTGISDDDDEEVSLLQYNRESSG